MWHSTDKVVMNEPPQISPIDRVLSASVLYDYCPFRGRPLMIWGGGRRKSKKEKKFQGPFSREK